MKKRKNLLVLFLVSMVTLVLIVITACYSEDITFQQANNKLSFPLLQPVETLEGWTLDDSVYEDNLFVTSYIDEDENRIELIQDQNIQGLNIHTLRDFLLFGETVIEESGEIEIREISHYVGEMMMIPEPNDTIQFTFVQKEDLLGSSENVPFYQVIGRGTSVYDVISFIEVLEVSS
ncbi:hypothetical protein LGQ02_05140 [Bacillus shivajii]|uniref:hypothetical protein n=1 Tax=Bacillus shivajii TaxID=1983719 RepID=UPI001CFA0029|nr:hypothetical protein [Bacillus shivajii]UCZ54150.1 hypothetical protein LGQ02_05140 [Bacillus shivajii]